MASLVGAAGAIAGILTARHAEGSLIIGGIDILLGASQSVLSFTYTDNTSDQADDISVQIADPARTWMQTYLPKKGVECQGKIKVTNWTVTGDSREFDCGTFWLDQIDFAGPPNTVSISATSIPVTSGIKTQKKYRSWENQDLMAIASQIATENGLILVWDTAKAIFKKIKRVDQVEMPDLEFLRDKAKDFSLSLKIFNRQLIIYSEEEYDQKPPVYTLIYGMSNIIGYSFSSKLDDTYKKAKNAYVNPETGQLIETEFEALGPPEGTGADLESNERVEEEEGGAEGDAPMFRIEAPALYDFSSAGASDDAEAKAKSKLREKNKYEKECTFTVVGNPGYLSGLNVQLVGFGIFDGKWFIGSSTHSISSAGYVTELQMRGALNGY